MCLSLLGEPGAAPWRAPLKARSIWLSGSPMRRIPGPPRARGYPSDQSCAWSTLNCAGARSSRPRPKPDDRPDLVRQQARRDQFARFQTLHPPGLSCSFPPHTPPQRMLRLHSPRGSDGGNFDRHKNRAVAIHVEGQEGARLRCQHVEMPQRLQMVLIVLGVGREAWEEAHHKGSNGLVATTQRQLSSSQENQPECHMDSHVIAVSGTAGGWWQAANSSK